MRFAKTGLLALGMMLIAVPAWALDMEYYTYGGYSAIVLAFQKIALIFTDSGYNALVFVIVVVSIFLGVASVLMSVAAGKKVYFLSWAPPILLGVAIYLALIVPKGSLTIYDPLMNRFMTVSGVPNGIVMIAGTLNKIERGLVDIIDTSGSVEGYKRTGGGMGFNQLLMATKGGFGLGNTLIKQSMTKYVQDCVMFELMRPGTTLTSEQLLKKSTNILNDFQLAASLAVWTTYYDDSNPSGTTMSCNAAYQEINSYLSNVSNLQEIVTQACSAMGFNTANATELSRCRENLSDFTSYIYNGTLSVSPEEMFRQVGIMEALDNIMKQDNTDISLRALTDKGIMASGISMGMVANDWLPVMRAVFTAVAVGLIPFIALFIPTGIIGKAAGLICGFFVWLTCWGITDCILHGIATDYAYQTMDYIRGNNLGYNAIMMFPSYTEKALSMFGFVRTAGIMLATILTSMLVSFGGHALAMMAGNIQGSLQSYAQGHSSVASGEEQARQIELGRNIQGAWDNAGKFNYREDTAARSALKQGQTGGAIDAMNRVGGKENFAAEMGKAGALGYEKQIAGTRAQASHEMHTGLNRMQSLEQQAFAKMSTMTANKDFTSTVDSAGAVRTDHGSSGALTYNNKTGELTGASGMTVNMSDMAKMRSAVATSAVEKLAAQVSRSASQSEAVSHLTKMGFSQQDAQGFTESIRGNTSWGRGSNQSDQTVHDNSYTQNVSMKAGADSSGGIGVPGSKMGASAGFNMGRNASETDRNVSTNTAENSLRVGFGKDWSTMRDHVASKYFGNETNINKAESYASSQGWSDVKESTHQLSQMKALETSAGQNTLYKEVEKIGNEKFGHITDVNERNYKALQDIERTFSASGRLGALSHNQIEGDISALKSNVVEFPKSMPQKGDGRIKFGGSGSSEIEREVKDHLKVAAQGAGYKGSVPTPPKDGGIR